MKLKFFNNEDKSRIFRKIKELRGKNET